MLEKPTMTQCDTENAATVARTPQISGTKKPPNGGLIVVTRIKITRCFAQLPTLYTLTKRYAAQDVCQCDIG